MIEGGPDPSLSLSVCRLLRGSGGSRSIGGFVRGCTRREGFV